MVARRKVCEEVKEDEPSGGVLEKLHRYTPKDDMS